MNKGEVYMIIVRAIGGLGNQMFQYAFYKMLKHYNQNVLLDISDYDIHNHHNGFELESVFKVKYFKANDSQIRKLSYDKKSVIYRTLKKIFNIELTKRTEFNESLHEIIKFDEYKKDIYFNGYWQSEKYFIDISDDIKSDFKFKNDLDSNNSMLIDKLINEKTVSVHIRRGDYLKTKSFLGVCDINYYNEAINIIKQKVKNPQFIFFSDDIEWVKGNFKLEDKCHFVDWNKGKDSYKDMQLMSMCKHNIIANSTFSWWGAWLNENSNKIIICPKKWSNDEKHKIEDIAPKNWILI